MHGKPLGNRKESMIGVDIGSRLLKICYAEPADHGRWKILRTSFAPTPRDSVRDGVVVDRAAVGNALRELIKSAGLSHVTGACAAIAGASVIVRHVKMTKMPEALLRKSVRYEAAKYISTSIESSVIEFEILGQDATEPDKMNVMLVAAPSDMIASRLETLEIAGLEPIAIDIEAFAVQRALFEMVENEPDKQGTLALLDIGASSADVTILAHGYFALTRNISIAGDHFTNAIRNAAKVGLDEAEQLKMQIDMSTLLSSDADPAEVEKARMMQPTLDELLREVRRSINYYTSQVAQGNLMLPIDPKLLGAAEEAENRRAAAAGSVSRLIITGGSAMLKGLHAYMAVRLGTVIEHANLFDKPELDTSMLTPSFIENHHSLFVLSAGLAIKRENSSGRRAKAA
jgi:type IV pilus assembly protein PilM